MRRLASFRQGDRAEGVGVELLRSFCAVAPIPREEDFGLADAVATILRRDGAFFFAEDSFLVQIKSRSQRRIEYLGDRFHAILKQDLPLMIAIVDLKRSVIELHTLGVALMHPNIHNAEGIVLHLRSKKQAGMGLANGILNMVLRTPILSWTERGREDRAFQEKAASVLAEWARVERWNRRHRRSGLLRHVTWETNELPKMQGDAHSFSPSRRRESLEELIPAAQLFASHANQSPKLRDPVRGIFDWLRQNQVEPDPAGVFGLMLEFNDAREALASALEQNRQAEVALLFSVTAIETNFIDFWLVELGRGGTAGSQRFRGTPESIRPQGIEVSIEAEGATARVILSLSPSWPQRRQAALIGATSAQTLLPFPKPKQILLLRAKQSQQQT